MFFFVFGYVTNQLIQMSSSCDPFISALSIAPRSKLSTLKDEVATTYWGKGGASSPLVPDSIRDRESERGRGRGRDDDADVAEFERRGGVFVAGPSDADVVAGRAAVGIVIRPGDFVVPICIEGINRSQVMHLVLACLRDEVYRHDGRPEFQVGVPHGAEGGYDPWKTSSETELSNDIGDAWVHRQVHSIITPASHPGAHPADTIFMRAFGVDRHERAGEAMCRAARRNITAEDYVRDLHTLTVHRRAQKREMETNFFHVPALKQRLAAPDGRVVVIAFSRAAAIFVRRLLHSNEPHASFAGIVVVSLPFNDTIKTETAQALDAFRLYAGIVRYDGGAAAADRRPQHQRRTQRGSKTPLQMAHDAKSTMDMLIDLKSASASAREAAEFDKEIAKSRFAYQDWLGVSIAEAQHTLDSNPYDEEATMTYQTADSELGHFLRHAGDGDGAASGSSLDAITYGNYDEHHRSDDIGRGGGGFAIARSGGQSRKIRLAAAFLRKNV